MRVINRPTDTDMIGGTDMCTLLKVDKDQRRLRSCFYRLHVILAFKTGHSVARSVRSLAPFTPLTPSLELCFATIVRLSDACFALPLPNPYFLFLSLSRYSPSIDFIIQNSRLFSKFKLYSSAFPPKSNAHENRVF